MTMTTTIIVAATWAMVASAFIIIGMVRRNVRKTDAELRRLNRNQLDDFTALLLRIEHADDPSDAARKSMAIIDDYRNEFGV